MGNEFLDLLTCYDMPEQGLEKFILNQFASRCTSFAFEEEVLTRLVTMCPQISHLQLGNMNDLNEEDRM